MTQYTLDRVVREYLVMKGMDSLHEYPRALQAAITTLKDLDYDVSGVPRVEVLEVSSTRAVLPQDVVRVMRMGFVNEGGKFVEIYVDNTIVVNAQADSISGESASIVAVNAGTPLNPTSSDFTNMLQNGQIVGRQYGNAGGGIYQYRMDWERGIVEFSSNVSGDVVLEYLGDPKKINGEYHVHPFLVDPIMDGIHWRMMKFKRSYSPAEKQEAHRIYLNSKHHSRIRFYSESIGNHYNAARKTFNQSIRY